jgi:hypothetical protein
LGATKNSLTILGLKKKKTLDQFENRLHDLGKGRLGENFRWHVLSAVLG